MPVKRIPSGHSAIETSSSMDPMALWQGVEWRSSFGQRALFLMGQSLY